MAREISDKHKAVFNTFRVLDPYSYGVFKMLDDIYPAFAKKIFDENNFMQRLVMSGLNPMYILDYPICGRCETLASMSGYKVKNGRMVDVCTCHKCGASTTNPVLLREWMRDELKKKSPEKTIDMIDYAVDEVALIMMRKAVREMEELISGQKPDSLIDINGKPLKCEVTLEEVHEPVDLDEELKKLAAEEDLDVQQIE